jgi:fused signal recognition particle receptor
MMEMLGAKAQAVEASPRVILVLGVNGVGKTTTIAKLARSFRESGKSVLLVACDTFRAAATEQLKEWGSRVGCEVVAQGEGADAAAVAFDGVSKAGAKGYDVVILDTAGRIHTKSNLMEELRKIDRVIGRALPGAPHDKLLVIDSTVGANGLSQAREFHKALGLTGVIVTKLDGTAKGGVLLAISGELGIPITHIGVGEKMDDLKPFDPAEYVKTILG